MKTVNAAFAVAMIAAIVLTAMPLNGQIGFASAEGTRVGEAGWQYDTFDKNLAVKITPEETTTTEDITITVTSKISEVWIKAATLYGVVYPRNQNTTFPFNYPFFKVNDTSFEYVLKPFSQFQAQGYDIEFFLFVYDYFYESMDSRSYTTFEYSILSSGWKNSTFEENIHLTYWPMNVNATEEVVITIVSVHNIPIQGANLYITYQTSEGNIETGGYNLSKTNANSTEMSRKIPGYPAGTNVTFWVTAWDQYTTLMTSKNYNYSVMGIAQYTDYPFEYTDETDDRSLWIPTDAILIPMAAMAALAIPLFLYLYALNLKRRKRAVDMVTTKKAQVKTEDDVKEAE